MGLFQYKGRKSGEPVVGRLEAASTDAVASHLASLGVVPVEIAPIRQQIDVLDRLRERFRRDKVSIDDMIVFCRQMFSITRSGVPILRGIRAICETTPSKPLVAALEDVIDGLESGHGLGASLRRHPNIFSNMFVSVIEIGEDTGRLEEGFDQLSTYLEIERETRKRVKSATRYPFLVIGAILIALVILNLFALPVFAEIFRDFGVDLPLATRILIGMSDFSKAYWPHIAVGFATTVFAIRAYLKTESGELRWDRWKLRMPVVGKIVEKATLARFARTFALSQRSGVPLIQGLRMASEIVDNAWMGERVLQMRSTVERGESLSRTAAASGLFTPLVLQMMSIGEESGALDELLQEVAELYERDVEYDLKRLADAIEPIMIVAIGVMVLVLALGVYMPMWDLARAANNG